MTVAALAASITHNEDGVTLSFAAPFRYLDASHLVVQRIAADGTVTTLVQGASWSATAGTTDAGGTVTLTATVAGAKLRIRRRTPRGQTTQFPTNGTFPAKANETALDRAMLVDQEQDDATGSLETRVVRVPDGETAPELPAAAARADRLLGFDPFGAFDLYTPSALADAIAGYLPANLKGDPGGNAMAVGRAIDINGIDVPLGTDLIRTTGYSVQGLGAGFYIADAAADAALAAAHPRACKATANGRYFRLLPDAGGAIGVDALGTAADGVTDDLAAIDAARNYAVAIGAGRLAFTARKQYRTTAFIASGNNLAWDFNGATLKCSASAEVFGANLTGATLLGYVTDEITGPTSTLKVSTTAGFSVGQFILVRLGHNPWDNVEPRWGQSCKVVSINAGASTITIDVLVPEAIPLSAYTYKLADGSTVAVPAVAGAGSNRAIYALTDGDNVEVNDLVFVGDTANNASVEGVLWFQGGRNLRLNNVRGNLDAQGTADAGTGLIGLLQFCRNVVVNDAILLGNKNGRNQASLGRMFNVSNCVNVQIRNPVARDLQSTFLFAESFCEQVVIDSPAIEYTATTAAGVAAFFVAQGSQVVARDPYIVAPQGKVWYMTDDGGADGQFHVTGRVRIRGQYPASFYVNAGVLLDYDGAACAPTTITIAGTTMTLASGQAGLHPGVEVRGNGIATGTIITAETGGGVYTVNNAQAVAAGTPAFFREYAVVDYRASRSVAVRIPMNDAGAEYGLAGPFWQLTCFASANADPANIDVYPLRGGYGSFECSGAMQAGKAVQIRNAGLTAGGVNNVKLLTGVGAIIFYRTAGSPTPGAFLGFTALVPLVVKSSLIGAAYPLNSGGLASYSDTEMEDALIGRHSLRGSATYDAPSIAAGGTTTTSLVVGGAAIGDRVAVALGVDPSGLVVTGYVSSVSTVTVVLFNPTAGAIDLASTTLTVEVTRA